MTQGLTSWEKELAKRFPQQDNQPAGIPSGIPPGLPPGLSLEQWKRTQPTMRAPYTAGGLMARGGPVSESELREAKLSATPRISAESLWQRYLNNEDITADMAQLAPDERRQLELRILSDTGGAAGDVPTEDAGFKFTNTFWDKEGKKYGYDEFGQIQWLDYDPSKAQEAGETEADRLRREQFEYTRERDRIEDEREATQGLTDWEKATIAYRERQRGDVIDQNQAAMIADREAAIRGEQAQSRDIAAQERMREQDRQLTRQAHLAELQANPRKWVEAAAFEGKVPTMPDYLAPYVPGSTAGSPITAGAQQGAKAPMTPMGAQFNRFTPTQQEQTLGYQSFLGQDPQDYLRKQQRISPPRGGGGATYQR